MEMRYNSKEILQTEITIIQYQLQPTQQPNGYFFCDTQTIHCPYL